MIKFPPIENRLIVSNQGRPRMMLRLAGQRRWYRSLASAQIAWQRGEDRKNG